MSRIEWRQDATVPRPLGGYVVAPEAVDAAIQTVQPVVEQAETETDRAEPGATVRRRVERWRAYVRRERGTEDSLLASVFKAVWPWTRDSVDPGRRRGGWSW